MTALSKWNVRIIDYLIERGVDPFVTDKFGFTAKKKAEIRLAKQLITGDLVLKASKSGLQKISLEIVNQKGQLLKKQESFIKIIDNKKNIIVAYNNPHPDVAALQSALENFNDYSVKICPTEGLKLEDLIKQNLLIFVGLPNAETWKMIEKSNDKIEL